MTFAHLGPLLAVSGFGLALLLLAVLLHFKVAEDSDAGCLIWILGIIGAILLWNGTDAITALMSKP